jgi:4-hydroxybenzoyl-CoA reductase subunit alpha
MYTVDMKLPGMLYGKILRSPYPHARIIDIDTSRAEKLPGVKAVIAGKDTLGVKYGTFVIRLEFLDKYALAMDKVRFIGEAVAAVAAMDEDIAEEALDLIRVEYEELPAVFDPEEAMKEGAPLVHDNFERNINFTYQTEWGDVERGFEESDYVRQDRFATHTQIHATLEPRASLASFDPSGKLTIWTSTQAPYFLHRTLVITLGLRQSDVKVIRPHVGGGFGGKLEMFPSDFCSALLSRKTAKPVRIEYTRDEDFIDGRRRHPFITELRTGVKKDGTLAAVECRHILDGGAYTITGPVPTMISGTFPFASYRIPSYRYLGQRVYTNKMPSGAMRGHGAPQGAFAFESQLDLIAGYRRVEV